MNHGLIGLDGRKGVRYSKDNPVGGCLPASDQQRSVNGSMTETTPAAKRANRLIREKSPYLLQHAYNPVDWYPWGEEAFAKAQQEDKPIFLSIGYSTCHWCHVMERESFENPEIAELLNRWFVSIKVDREEHPDVDHVYMRAVMTLAGQGGWPLTAFLTPDLKPFFGGTYVPPVRRGPLAGMHEILPAVADAWKNRRAEIATSADQLTASLQERFARQASPHAISPELLDAAMNEAAAAFDAAHGGFGDAPKFPRSHELSFLLRYWARTGTGQALEMVTVTLDRLACGGIHDQLGGGFHRYATDAQWLVPHFEKMLYDQALLAMTYVEAYRVTKRADYAEVARGIFEYVLRDLAGPQGGFYSAEDADSEGEEGKFYVWTPEEVLRVLGQDDGALFNRFYGVTAEGNFEHGRSILHVEQPLEAFAKLKELDPQLLKPRLASCRKKLLADRELRVRPHRDDKILTSWNGLMIAALAYGGATLNEPRYLEAAQHAAEFILKTLVRDGGPFDSAQGRGERAPRLGLWPCSGQVLSEVEARAKRVEPRLLRRYRDGEALYPGTLEDYAFFTHGLFELYEASFDPRWLSQAKPWTARMIERFWDEEEGGFFLRGKDEPPLIVPSKELYDGATPSGNSMAVLVLARLGRLMADQHLESLSRRALDGFSQAIERAPFSVPQMLSAADVILGPAQEIVIAGDLPTPGTHQMIREIHQRFLPRAVVIVHPTGPGGEAIETLVPSVKAQGALRGGPTGYVCQHDVCRLPATDLKTFVASLESTAPHRVETP